MRPNGTRAGKIQDRQEGPTTDRGEPEHTSLVSVKEAAESMRARTIQHRNAFQDHVANK